jgi:hypothetical protein
LGAAALAVLSYVSKPLAIALIVAGSLLVGSPALALQKKSFDVRFASHWAGLLTKCVQSTF